MAVAIVATDVWLSHLEFTGGRRQTEFGPIDGIFYGVVSGIGDASGGNITLNGNVSFERKEDWIYVVQSASAQVNTSAATGDDAFIIVNTGPIIPTSSAVANPSFTYGGDMKGVTNNAVTVLSNVNSGLSPFKEIPVFGDKRISGVLQFIAAGFEDNLLNATYTLSVYGWLIRYNGFFRNVGGSMG